MPRRKPTAVMIVPTTPVPETAPPASPLQLGLRRFGVVIAAVLPLVIAALVDAYQRGEVQVPERWAVPVSIAIAVYFGYTKTQKEQGRAADAAHLESRGLPVGKPLAAEIVRESLFTERHLPAYVPPPPRPTGPDPGRRVWP